ncbi:hypothetical protein CBS147343_1158 [Aspergillus niger]|nr:hypothetical protein CBS133816_4320 [Aspergillus niger]KAI2859016.1 hypothetical protein CBS12448_5894 [Aspergillus niger]KAI2917013.1 hypothetical protein CBS147371_4963 [Aspergillus niger]KAI2939299.1 hypothetical protein CBS147321_6813 [Aspergillus niger]KAI2974520.1 hypothetical protein CBS147324_3480 [Aspergillus niger]
MGLSAITAHRLVVASQTGNPVYLRLHYVTDCFYPTSDQLSSDLAGPPLLVPILTLPILPSKDSCFSSETTLLQTSTSYTMRAATLLLVALSAVALALPTTNNVERAAADANVRQMDELTVAAISK